MDAVPLPTRCAELRESQRMPITAGMILEGRQRVTQEAVEKRAGQGRLEGKSRKGRNRRRATSPQKYQTNTESQFKTINAGFCPVLKRVKLMQSD